MPSPVHPYSDYGVALRTLKSARSWLGLLMFVCVVAQMGGFALMWWSPQPYEHMKPELTSRPSAVAATTPYGEEFFPQSEQGRLLNVRKQWELGYTMLVPVTQISSLIAVSSQAIIVFVTLLVVLIAQAPGIAQMTRSLIWSVLLLFMFCLGSISRDFPIPGVIYSYVEMLNRITPVLGGHRPVFGYQIWLVYGRFIAWPLVGLFVLLITSERDRAGVMIAIGHPLQSILQPRGGSLPPPGMPKLRPLAPLSAGPGKPPL